MDMAVVPAPPHSLDPVSMQAEPERLQDETAEPARAKALRSAAGPERPR